MTHAEALVGNRSGLPPSTCPGELQLIDTFLDRHLASAGMVEESIAVWECADCGTRVSIGAERGALNAYHPIPPREMVAKLAEGFKVPK